ncbi:MAG: hypothetical protein AAF630_03145 [Cyanobacteria bacterium P01_C01_bin.38]
MQKYNLVVRASCSLDIHSEQDAFPYGNTALTHYKKINLHPQGCSLSVLGKTPKSSFQSEIRVI